MIITTTQDLAAVGSCDCSCSLPTCAAPRKECESINAVAESTGEIKAADTTWKRYTIKNDIITLVQSLSDPDKTWTSSATDSTGYEWDRLFSGSVTGTECTEWIATRADACESTGSATLTFYDTSGDPPVRGDRATDSVKNRTDISGTDIPDSDPLEQYAPCTYLDTTVDTDYRDDPPTVTTTTSIGGNITTVYSYTGTPATSSTVYEGGQTYAEWVAATRAAIDLALDFDTEECKGEVCISTITTDPEPTVETGLDAEVGMTITKSRYRFAPPIGFSTVELPRTTYEAQWDEVSFPTGYNASIDDPEITPPDPLPPGWEHPQIPTPGRPNPSLVASRSWIWDGNMESPWSEWFEIPIPEAAGETRAVNLMILCYRSARLGQKPTAHGEVYAI